MATATFDKTTYRPGDTGVLTVNYADVADGTVSFTAQIAPSGGGTPQVLTASSTIEADLRDPVIKVGATVRPATRVDDPANNRVTFTFTV